MENNEESTEMKQAYLREAILDAGYDPAQFVIHLESVKSDGGADLDNWTLEELKREVTKYKEYYAREGNPSPPPRSKSEDKTEGKSEEPKEVSVVSPPAPAPTVAPVLESLLLPLPIQLPPPEVKKPEPPKEEEKKAESPVAGGKEESAGPSNNKASVAQPLPAGKIVQTKKISHVPGPDFKANITEVKTVNPGFFSYKYEVYVISTPAKGYLVERKHSAFDELRMILVKLHPGYMAPILPKTPLKKFDPSILENRRQKLQLFLDDLLRHPVLRCSKLLTRFLSEKNEKAYEEYKKKFEKVPCPKEVSQCYTLEGIANVAYNSHVEHDCGEAKSAIEGIKAIYRELKPLNGMLSADLSHLAETTNKISEAYKHIAGYYGAAVKGAKMFELFYTLSEVFNSLSSTCKKLQGTYMENFDHYFRRQKREMTAMEEVVGGWKEAWTQYIKFDKRMQEKKEALYELKQADKWELADKCPYPIEVLLKNREIAISQMLPKETGELAKCEEIYGYFCNKVCEEFCWVCRKEELDTYEHLTGVSRMYGRVFETVCLMWTDLAKRLAELKAQMPALDLGPQVGKVESVAVA